MKVNVNAYVDKNGKSFIVVQRGDEKPIFINEGLIKYALEHKKSVKEGK